MILSRGGGFTHLGLVLDPDLPKFKARVPIIVTPKDCVPSDDIQNNIKANLTKIDSWIDEKCRINNEIIFVVSAGPSLDVAQIKEDKEMLEEGNKTVKVVCVKHSLPILMDNGLVPWHVPCLIKTSGGCVHSRRGQKHTL